MKIAMSNDLKHKIKMSIKNRQDIADLIRNVNIKGEDFTGAIITELDVHDEDITGTNFTRAIIGQKGTKSGNMPWVNFNRAIARDCSFIRTTFPGIVWARRVDARGCNFKGAFMPYVDYKYANMKRCNFCDTVFSFGTQKSYGAVFSPDLFQDLAKFWGITITINGTEGNDYE